MLKVLKGLLVVCLVGCVGVACADTLKTAVEQPSEVQKNYTITNTRDMESVDGSTVTVVTGRQDVTKAWLQRREVDLQERKVRTTNEYNNQIAEIDKALAQVQAFLAQIKEEVEPVEPAE